MPIDRRSKPVSIIPQAYSGWTQVVLGAMSLASGLCQSLAANAAIAERLQPPGGSPQVCIVFADSEVAAAITCSLRKLEINSHGISPADVEVSRVRRNRPVYPHGYLYPAAKQDHVIFRILTAVRWHLDYRVYTRVAYYKGRHEQA